MVQIDLGERLIRLADKVLSKNSNETIGHTGGITNATANDTYIPTTKAVKEYVDEHEHQHGNIQNNGSIGSTANKPIITTTNGILTTGSFGTSANTFCQGNDNRLSNDRNPISHAVNDTRYGAASSTNYGHIRVMDNLTSTGTTDALSANQGKELKTLVDTKVPITDIKDNLTSSDINKPLSANQGKVLKSLVDTKANQNHTHENISDSGWQNVVFESGFQNYDSNHPVRYRRIGKIVHLEGIIKNSSAFTPNLTEKKVAFIDDIYCRPNYSQYALMQGTDGNKFLLAINTNGDISIARYGTTGTNTQVAANSWLHCYSSWMIDTEQISIPTSIIEYNSDATLDNAFFYTIQLKNNNNNSGISNKNIEYYLDNVLQETEATESNGAIEFSIPYSTWSDKGNHTLRFDFTEDETYRASTMSTTINYDNVTRPTTMTDFNIYDYNISNNTLKFTLRASLTDTNNNPIGNKTIKYYLDNVLKTTTTTQNDGTFSFNIQISTNTSHTIKIMFEEDLPYRSCTQSIPYENMNLGPGTVG